MKYIAGIGSKGLEARSPDNFEIEKLWDAILHILMGKFPNKKINFCKGQNARNFKGLQSLHQFLSYSTSVIENIQHTLTPYSLSSYSLGCPEKEIVKVQSFSKQPVLS